MSGISLSIICFVFATIIFIIAAFLEPAHHHRLDDVGFAFMAAGLALGGR